MLFMKLKSNLLSIVKIALFFIILPYNNTNVHKKHQQRNSLQLPAVTKEQSHIILTHHHLHFRDQVVKELRELETRLDRMMQRQMKSWLADSFHPVPWVSTGGEPTTCNRRGFGTEERIR